MIVWGGADGSLRDDGYEYDPNTDTWAGPITTTGAPVARWRHSAVWTGKEMIAWGGEDGIDRINTGGAYEPLINLSAGTYNGTLTVSAPGASNNPQIINTTFTVSP